MSRPRDAGLEEACLAAPPEDDLPWRVYADWLDDHGAHDRANRYRRRPEDAHQRAVRWMGLLSRQLDYGPWPWPSEILVSPEIGAMLLDEARRLSDNLGADLVVEQGLRFRGILILPAVGELGPLGVVRSAYFKPRGSRCR